MEQRTVPAYYGLMLLLIATNTAHCLECFCDETTSTCVDNKEPCEQGITHCYYRRQLLGELTSEPSKPVERYGCLNTGEGFARAICSGDYNAGDIVWMCCNASDLCNEALQAVLPIETVSHPSSVTTRGTREFEDHQSSESSAEDSQYPEPDTGPHNIVVILVGAGALAFGIIVFFSLSLTGLALRYRRIARERSNKTTYHEHNIERLDSKVVTVAVSLTSKSTFHEQKLDSQKPQYGQSVKSGKQQFSAVNAMITSPTDQAVAQTFNLLLPEEMSVDQSLSE